MSIIDQAIAAVTPLASDEDRQEARQKARACARPGDWLSQILEHHLGLETAFAEVKAAGDAGARTAALKQLGLLLVGHAQAEEVVIYPAMTEAGETGKSGLAYQQQATVKVEMAMLEALDPTSEDFTDKLEHIRGAVAQHMYEEEGTWFPTVVQEATPTQQAKITERYAEEYERYVGNDGGERSAMRFGGGGPTGSGL